MTFALDNAEERARLYPGFEIPGLEIRTRLGVGDMAKLIFLPLTRRHDGCTGERMWVEIVRKTETSDGAVYEGALCCDPALLEIPRDTLVTFGPRHIIDVDAD